MRFTGRKFAWIAVFTVAAAFLAVWLRNWREEAREAHADFEWFSTLGFPDVKGLAWARVATGQWSQSQGQPPKNHYIKGFLLATNGGNFSVFTLELLTQTMTNSRAGAPEHERVGFEVLDLRRDVADRLQQLRHAPGGDNPWPFFARRLPEQAEVFALAWACWRQGLDSEARSLYQEAKMLPRRQTRYPRKATLRERAEILAEYVSDQAQRLASKSGRKQPAPFRETIGKDVANVLMWQAVGAFGAPSVSRPQLLRRFEAIARNYPHSEHHQRALETAKVLARMIGEDAAHAKSGPKAGAQLTVEQQVSDLIFRLRDQEGHGGDGYGMFDDWHGNTNTPAHQLERLEYAAVPQLIAALDSDTLTRSMRSERFSFPPASLPTVRTVGDCAARILRRITGCSFFVIQPNNSRMPASAQKSAARKAAEAWWAEFQKKGEKQMLVEAVAAGGADAEAQAELLSQKYPDIAAATLVSGALATSNSWTRVKLVEQMAKVRDPASIGFLNQELTNGPELRSRVAAAYCLLPHNRAAAVAAMLREWEIFTLPDPNSSGDLEWDELVDFLAGRDSIDTVAALMKDLGRRPVEVRVKVVESLGDKDLWVFGHQVETRSAATLEAIEKRLVSALEDNRERANMSGTWNEKSVSNPFVSDLAGHFLAERWPDRYNFDFSASRRARERQRVECLNVWRKAHGLAALPVPPPPATHVGRNESTRVTLLEWAADAPPPQKSFAAEFDALKNKPLRAESLVRLLASFAARPEPGAAGLEINATRDNDLTGVQLVIRLIPGPHPTQAQGWGADEHVLLGSETLLDSSGTGTLDNYGQQDWWEDFAKAAGQAIAGSPETPFEITVRLAGSGVH